MVSALLEARGLAHRVAGRRLWDALTFGLDPGDRLALVAPSGAGKTLLLRALARLDPLQHGELCLLGRASADWETPQWRAHVSYLAQRPVAFPGSVEDNLRDVFRYSSQRQVVWSRDRVVRWLEDLEREPSFLDLDALRLSGGELQILAILRALQLEPVVLLLDEPTASLDPASTEQVETLLDRWLGEGRRGCVITSHQAAQMERFTNRRLQLSEWS